MMDRPSPGELSCRPCENAIALDQVATLQLENAEIAVIACDEHLRRVVLALEVLEAVEAVEQFTIPPLADAAFYDRLIVSPKRPQS